MKIIEVKGDLFDDLNTKPALVHCISADIHMCKGIAVQFKKRFGKVKEMKKVGVDAGKSPGGCIALKFKDITIFNLITKNLYYHKPTLDDLSSSLTEMCKIAEQENITEVHMPRIGCGLDGLLWSDVKEMIENIFKASQISITVYTL